MFIEWCVIFLKEVPRIRGLGEQSILAYFLPDILLVKKMIGVDLRWQPCISLYTCLKGMCIN